VDTKKNIDRLYYSAKAKRMLEQIDETNYLGLGRKGITRSELFLFAMSLGVESRTMTEVASPTGLVLDKSIDSTTHSLMYAQYIHTLEDVNNLDEITDRNEVYNMAEQYANTGFEIIADYLNNTKPNDLVWDLLLELDAQYEEIRNQ